MNVREILSEHSAEGDAGAFAIVVGSMAEMLPPVSAVLSIVWLSLRIWESDTLREWTGRQRIGPGRDDT